MSKFIKKCKKNPLHIITALGIRGFLNWLPNSLRIKIIFRCELGYFLNLKNPKSFNEKIQWLKFYGDIQQYTHLVDKHEVRKYISDTIGENYLIPLLGIWDKFEEIDFSKLPEQFVLKCNHDCGSVVICTDKATFDIKKAKNKLNKCLKQNNYYSTLELQYKNIKPKIICEKYMKDESGELKDYKIFCFNGEPKIIQVNYGRFTDSKKNLYDIEWNYVPVAMTYPTDPNVIINKPNNLKEMLTLAKTLSKDYPFVRVDFYSIEGKTYFGELTFTPAMGLGKFEPEEFDFEMGSWLELLKEEKI